MNRCPRPWLRPLAVRLHRWMGLLLGLWFALLGVSGAILVWHGEIDRALNPAWLAPLPGCGATTDAPIAVSLALFHAHAQGVEPQQVAAPITPGAAYMVTTRPGKDGLRQQHFIDPHCGLHLGARTWGALRPDRAHAVPALYEFHRALLSREAGHVAVGLAGFAFLLLIVSGAINAWPRHQTRDAWTRTLTLKSDASTHRRYYDLHRATGMWTLAFLSMMALTGIYLCFPKQVRTVMALGLPTSPVEMRKTMALPAVVARPDLLVHQAGQRWPDAQWTRIQLPVEPGGSYDVRLLQRGELRVDTGDTRVRMRPDGGVVDVRDPLRARAGDRLVSWLFPLHSGEALGMPGRVAWTVSGLVPPLLLATGVWLWARRRRQRHVGPSPPAAMLR